jgi:hypothetical protein
LSDNVIFDDTSAITTRVVTLATELGEQYGDAGGQGVDLGTDEATWQQWRQMVWAFDDDEDQAMQTYGITALSDNATEEIGRDFVYRFNRGFFSGYVERIRRRLDDLEA